MNGVALVVVHVDLQRGVVYEAVLADIALPPSDFVVIPVSLCPARMLCCASEGQNVSRNETAPAYPVDLSGSQITSEQIGEAGDGVSAVCAVD